MQDVVLRQMADLYKCIFQEHDKSNIADQDGKPCYKCHLPIPVLYPTRLSKKTGRCFVKVDRTNRVDVELRVKTHGKERVSYHIECWKSLIFKHDR